MQSRLIQPLRDFQRGQPAALLARVSQPLSLDEITIIQAYLSWPRVRAKPHSRVRQANLLPQLHYHLFLRFNQQLAQQSLPLVRPHQRFKQRMYIVKYVAKQCFAHSKTLAMAQIRFGIRYQRWQALP